MKPKHTSCSFADVYIEKVLEQEAWGQNLLLKWIEIQLRHDLIVVVVQDKFTWVDPQISLSDAVGECLFVRALCKP